MHTRRMTGTRLCVIQMARSQDPQTCFPEIHSLTPIEASCGLRPLQRLCQNLDGDGRAESQGQDKAHWCVQALPRESHLTSIGFRIIKFQHLEDQETFGDSTDKTCSESSRNAPVSDSISTSVSNDADHIVRKQIPPPKRALGLLLATGHPCDGSPTIGRTTSTKCEPQKRPPETARGSSSR